MKKVRGNISMNYFACNRNAWRIRAGIFPLVVCSFVAGCAGSNGSNPASVPIGLPTTTPPSTTNNYVGTQSPGLWSLTLDDTQDAYSYQALTYPANPNVATSGNFVNLSGYLSLQQAGVQNGYALEIPSNAAILRPGDNTVPPVLAVQQSNCFPINGNVTFQFVFIPNSSANLSAAPTTAAPSYGTIAVSTNADGSSWSFGGQILNRMPATLNVPGLAAIPPGTQTSTQYLTNFTATCSVTNGLGTIAAPANANLFNSGYSVATNYVIGASGFFIEDQSPTKVTNTQPAPPAAVGVVRPSAQLTTSSVVAGAYLGFMYENGVDPHSGTQITTTQPIGFGQVVAGAGSTMSGAVFANDDVTQIPTSPIIPPVAPGFPATGGTPLANTIINLGTQDSVNNGIYPSATITAPDPTQQCAPQESGNGQITGIAGVDANGNETCTFNAVAVVGNSASKYVIFISSFDATTHLSMGMYLFQQ